MQARKVLILGASYGSLLGVKLALAGHAVKLVCLPQEAALINAKGAIVRMPVKGREGLVEIDSRKLPGTLSADGPRRVRSGVVRPGGAGDAGAAVRLVGRARAAREDGALGPPCMSIMNMPPLPYLARVPGVDPAGCAPAYTDPSVWSAFDPKLVTLCSPDPQAFRPPEDEMNVLQVRLPTNFKAARFDSDAHTALLRELAAGIEAARFDVGAKSWSCRSSSRCTTRSSSRSPSGRC
jgi:hypothetical protein